MDCFKIICFCTTILAVEVFYLTFLFDFTFLIKYCWVLVRVECDQKVKNELKFASIHRHSGRLLCFHVVSNAERNFSCPDIVSLADKIVEMEPSQIVKDRELVEKCVGTLTRRF